MHFGTHRKWILLNSQGQIGSSGKQGQGEFSVSPIHPSMCPSIGGLFIYRDALGKIFCCVLRFLITIFVLFLYLLSLTWKRVVFHFLQIVDLSYWRKETQRIKWVIKNWWNLCPVIMRLFHPKTFSNKTKT